MPAGRQNLNGNWFAGLRPKVITCELERQVKGRGKPNKRMEGSKEKQTSNKQPVMGPLFRRHGTMIKKNCRWLRSPTSQMPISPCKEALIAFPLFALPRPGQCWPPLETLSDRMTSNCFRRGPLWPEAPATSKHSASQATSAICGCMLRPRYGEASPCM